MANVSHATLTGADLHEPKGVSAATSGQIYIANGSGSGSWSSASAALGFTGQIADFGTPVPPTGWLECDGSSVARAAQAALFAAITIQQTGTTILNNPQITVTSTTNMKVGYFVGGSANITHGSTILTVDDATHITISTNATGNGSPTVVVSPWLFDGTNFTLPDSKTSGRYRRSRTTTVQMGQAQTELLKNHTHTGVTGTESATHNHTVNLTDPGHSHSADRYYDGSGAARLSASQTIDVSLTNATSTNTTGISVSSVGTESATHTHTILTGNPDGGIGGVETRPVTIVVMTCIKT